MPEEIVRDASKFAITRDILTALSLQSVDDVKGSDSLSLGVLSVGDSVTDDTLKEGLEDTTCLLVDHGRDTLDTTTTSETTNSGLGDNLDVVAQNLAVTLGTTLSKTLATFAACRDETRQRLRSSRVILVINRSYLRPVMLIDSYSKRTSCDLVSGDVEITTLSG